MLTNKLYEGENEFLEGNPAMKMWDFIDENLARQSLEVYLREARAFWAGKVHDDLLDEARFKKGGEEHFQHLRGVVHRTSDRPDSTFHKKALAKLITHPIIQRALPHDSKGQATSDLYLKGNVAGLVKRMHGQNKSAEDFGKMLRKTAKMKQISRETKGGEGKRRIQSIQGISAAGREGSREVDASVKPGRVDAPARRSPDPWVSNAPRSQAAIAAADAQRKKRESQKSAGHAPTAGPIRGKELSKALKPLRKGAERSAEERDKLAKEVEKREAAAAKRKGGATPKQAEMIQRAKSKKASVPPFVGTQKSGEAGKPATAETAAKSMLKLGHKPSRVAARLGLSRGQMDRIGAGQRAEPTGMEKGSAKGKKAPAASGAASGKRVGPPVRQLVSKEKGEERGAAMREIHRATLELSPRAKATGEDPLKKSREERMAARKKRAAERRALQQSLYDRIRADLILSEGDRPTADEVRAAKVRRKVIGGIIAGLKSQRPQRIKRKPRQTPPGTKPGAQSKLPKWDTSDPRANPEAEVKGHIGRFVRKKKVQKAFGVDPSGAKAKENVATRIKTHLQKKIGGDVGVRQAASQAAEEPIKKKSPEERWKLRRQADRERRQERGVMPATKARQERQRREGGKAGKKKSQLLNIGREALGRLAFRSLGKKHPDEERRERQERQRAKQVRTGKKTPDPTGAKFVDVARRKGETKDDYIHRVSPVDPYAVARNRRDQDKAPTGPSSAPGYEGRDSGKAGAVGKPSKPRGGAQTRAMTPGQLRGAGLPKSKMSVAAQKAAFPSKLEAARRRIERKAAKAFSRLSPEAQAAHPASKGKGRLPGRAVERVKGRARAVALAAQKAGRLNPEKLGDKARREAAGKERSFESLFDRLFGDLIHG